MLINQLDPIIAGHLYLQMVYIVSGFLFILCVNVYVLKTYNYIWSLVNRVFLSRISCHAH